VDPQLHCDHQHLKTAQETQRRIERELSQASEQLSSEKSRNSQLEQDVENYRARQKHISDLKLYQQKRPWIVRSSANLLCQCSARHQRSKLLFMSLSVSFWSRYWCQFTSYPVIYSNQSVDCLSCDLPYQCHVAVVSNQTICSRTLLICYGSIFTMLHLCRAVLATSKMSVHLSNAWIVIKWKKFLPRFLYRMKERCPNFPTPRMVGGGWPLWKVWSINSLPN